MTSILIITSPQDTHSIFLRVALSEEGHKVSRLMSSELFNTETASITFDNQSTTEDIEFICAETKAATQMDYDRVWLRRPKLIHPNTIQDTHTHNLFSREQNTFFDGLCLAYEGNAEWINPPQARSRIVNKVYQLKLARKLGFEIPQTIVTNDAAAVQNFKAKYKINDLIIKSFHTLYWPSDDGVKIMYTSALENSDLLTSQQLIATPSIVQERVPKAFEIRVVAFRSVLVAAKINTQIADAIDWRYEQNTRGIAVEPYKLPEDIESLCKNFMEKAGIKFGCFDFIVTPSGKHIFLEINESGQFLFLEELCPEIHLLDIAVNFLGFDNSVDNFIWQEREPQYTLKDLQTIVNTLKSKEENNYTSSVQLK
jgi:glutathione synthase/RimK-type ligase-like ATP-grasp enzyme